MTAARETLRSWFYRPWFLAMLAAVLSATLMMAGSYFVAIHQVEQNESWEMNARANAFSPGSSNYSGSCAKASMTWKPSHCVAVTTT